MNQTTDPQQQINNLRFLKGELSGEGPGLYNAISPLKIKAPSQHIYQMQPHTLQVFEENKRHRFCKISLRDLKESGFSADPKDPKQLETFIDLSKKLDTIGYHLQALQYRYFILFTMLGSSFLQDKNIEEHLMQLGTDTDRQEFLDHLIISNLQGEG